MDEETEGEWREEHPWVDSSAPIDPRLSEVIAIGMGGRYSRDRSGRGLVVGAYLADNLQLANDAAHAMGWPAYGGLGHMVEKVATELEIRRNSTVQTLEDGLVLESPGTVDAASKDEILGGVDEAMDQYGWRALPPMHLVLVPQEVPMPVGTEKCGYGVRKEHCYKVCVAWTSEPGALRAKVRAQSTVAGLLFNSRDRCPIWLAHSVGLHSLPESRDFEVRDVLASDDKSWLNPRWLSDILSGVIPVRKDPGAFGHALQQAMVIGEYLFESIKPSGVESLITKIQATKGIALDTVTARNHAIDSGLKAVVGTGEEGLFKAAHSYLKRTPPARKGPG